LSHDCPADGHTKPDIYGIHGAYKKIFVAENHVAAGNFATVVLASLPNREMGKGKIVTEVKPATEKSLDDALAFLNKIRRTPMLSRLLTDTQVANILHEHWKTYKDIQLDVKMDYPGTQALVRETLSKRKRSRKLWRDNTLVFAPVNVRLKEGHHWVILAWLMSGGEKTICYFDPLGNPAPRFLKGIFGGRDEPSDILEFERVQFDGFQCGVWICWWSATVLDWLAGDRLLRDFSLDGLVSTTAHTRALQLQNSRMVMRVRREYDNLLYRVSTQGTLAYT